MSISVLLTSAIEDSEEMLNWAGDRDVNLMHLPLEQYVAADKSASVDEAFAEMGQFETIVYGNKRNAVFFMRQAEACGSLDPVKNRVNLTLDRLTADYLERQGIPAISTFGDPKPINLVEFMLRLRRTGPTLYPCGSHTKDEIPGLLEELDIPVHELELYDLEGPDKEKLKMFRSVVAGQQPDVIIFHSRKAVNRTQAAFPDLDYSKSTIISADTGVTNKLEESGITVSSEAEGNWQSIIEKLGEQV